MKQKNYLWSVLAIVLVAMLCAGVTSCNDDDDDDDFSMSEKQIREILEAGSGTWVVTEVGDEGYNRHMYFMDGKTTGFEFTSSSYWMTPYSIKGNYVYIDKEVADEYHGDVLEGGIYITKLTSTQIEFYLADDPSEKYKGVSYDEYK